MADADHRDVQVLNQRLDALRLAYERYFAGLDKREPITDREQFRRELDRLTRAPITNTQARFQLNQIKGRFVTLQSHWNRVLAERERGTWRRDRFIADLHERERLAQPAEASEAPKAASQGAPKGAASITDDTVDKLYRAYITAKQRCNEPTDGITRERLAASLRKQAAKLAVDHPGSRAGFSVVIRDGKARIIARRSQDS